MLRCGDFGGDEGTAQWGQAVSEGNSATASARRAGSGALTLGPGLSARGRASVGVRCGLSGESGGVRWASGPSWAGQEGREEGARWAEHHGPSADRAEEKGGERSGPPGFAGPRGEGKRRWRAGPLRVLGWMLGLVFPSISLFLILIQTQAKRIQINLNSNSNQTTREKDAPA